MTGHVVVVDAGRSSCRAAASADGSVIRPAAVTPGLPLIAAENGISTVADALTRAVLAISREPAVVAAGLTGLFERMDSAPELAARLRAATGAGRVLITGDVVTSHAGALGGRPGVVVAAGTGTVALGVGHDGSWARVDGWGFAVGDAGSGYDIGRAGLAAALRHHDGRGGSAHLAELAQARFGHLDRLTATLYSVGNLAGTVAAFAADVAAAARDGDDTARLIWHNAAHELARTAIAAAERVRGDGDSVQVSSTGALFKAGDLLEMPFRQFLAARCPYAVPVPASGDALDGAALLAAGHADALSAGVVTA
ncbi:ATPase [Phytoactinopolyspora alkaliphila]|uniref:ATPase n=1 Tax=Phytoactinopolyspora alkaliphila TaxID=1783498 RepID=A0A6N9YIY0_9ACTN|nr:BadF/BadG/BcrA/BcrD ATPase family protein [Phytoactinopolyspora alkaliphila]NED94895.1 ATPase [Phytoactinopolyspora alkaliphila]